MKVYKTNEVFTSSLQKQRDEGDGVLWVKWSETSEEEKRIINVERALSGWYTLDGKSIYTFVAFSKS